MARTTPSFKGLKPASEKASRAARGSSKKTDTKPEKLLRSALWKAGLRFRKNVKDLPGKPDIVFTKAKVAVFVDGDFWHGKDCLSRKNLVQIGHNAHYWKNKIDTNVNRDRNVSQQLSALGWRVLRLWESDILHDLEFAARMVASSIVQR